MTRHSEARDLKILINRGLKRQLPAITLEHVRFRDCFGPRAGAGGVNVAVLCLGSARVS